MMPDEAEPIVRQTGFELKKRQRVSAKTVASLSKSLCVESAYGRSDCVAAHQHQHFELVEDVPSEARSRMAATIFW